ncbi:sugar ABC transporter permease [Carnobacterium divergens]|uniref:carbohydrate ABC transporter permease n=2 Tax=Carnobacteriaceae TaxID=186828 RepID=UPI00289091D6|nr:sugar ABC transporter permease [Carnobacterium divergens]MDT1951401.1 sugar ABC transporter permease [Carnobacterium divergens]MDT1956458.1 sugar ABC transporter permease [Carnobacterium divergens]MDT1961768.1 sugar ABC transporter permease [Carnobacterium divergens]
MIGVILFYLLPLIWTVFSSFNTKEIGFSNYQNVFTNDAFRLAMKNSFKFIIVCVPLLLFSSLMFSLMIFKRTDKISLFLKSISLLPFAVPVSTIVVVWKSIFNESGFLNIFLFYFGIESIDWLNSEYSFFVLVFTYIWKNMGYTAIIWLAGLNAIPEAQHEAAKIDGASPLQAFLFVSLPNLKQISVLLVILSTLNSFKVFREIYLIGGDYPDQSIYMLQHLLNNWFRDLNISNIAVVGTLMGVFLSIIILLLFKFMNGDE